MAPSASEYLPIPHSTHSAFECLLSLRYLPFWQSVHPPTAAYLPASQSFWTQEARVSAAATLPGGHSLHVISGISGSQQSIGLFAAQSFEGPYNFFPFDLWQ